MKKFLERNKSVFIIGTITLGVFIAIIFINTLKETQEPDLVKLEGEDAYVIIDDTSENANLNIDGSQPNQIDTNLINGSQPEETNIPSFDERLGILEIEYYEKWGFNPKRIGAINGQLIKWINTTDKDIYLIQKKGVYPELEEPTLIKAGETFEFRVYKEGSWAYEERETKNYGIIDVTPNTIP